ncbi:UDP-N-acetylmuramoylalanyl-D-glutamate--2,6-diaminopimelate ligase [Frankineae bacterium MT45]|nr:UDP-N-acetylmuramoylalanyl-D-glutamate--2,6-diaminopimelate ligase [Frankineae bacterium MT45]
MGALAGCTVCTVTPPATVSSTDVAAVSKSEPRPRPATITRTPLGLVAQVGEGRLSALPEAVSPSDDQQLAQLEVTGITATSSQVRPGDLFAALPGGSGHGARYADEAIARGALAILTDEAGARILSDRPGSRVACLVVDDVRARLGAISSQVYGFPSVALQMIGVTGTSGKTTTTFFVRAGLQAAGIGCGLIGTVATMIGDESVSTGFTTPEAPDLQALLARMIERGAQSVAMEVSSHALALGRADGIDFAVSAFTNLSHDHLEFHPTMEDYFQTKARLFDWRTLVPIVMVDDEWGARLATQLAGRAVTVSSREDVPATWTARDIAVDDLGQTTFQVSGPGVQGQGGCQVPGRYNVANALLALVILHHAGVPLEVAAPAVAAASVPGRMERIDGGQPFLVVVDYSHKPAAVQGALAALRPLTRGRLIIVLGCGGDRDRQKRPLMGAVAARDSDVLIVTDDNPRSEDPAAIRAAMLAGIDAHEHPAQVIEIGDRRAAIARAIELAGSGDTVLIAGKGHETGQEIAGEVHPFDDRDVARAVLAS